MTSVGMAPDHSRTMGESLQGRTAVQRVMLVCGILALALYVVTDVLGGLRYPGYSFTAQTISELAAVGAPTAALVGPLFMMYPVLEVVFAAGVIREAAGRNRALRIAGATLVASAALGIAAAWFPMRAPRGLGSLAADAPHIIVFIGIVLLLLLAMGFGAFALGRRFRFYSLASIVTVLVFGALTGQFVARVGAGQPTPGLGIIERVEVYTSLVWIAVLAAALLRRPSYRPPPTLP